jgi:hypothetical protein
MIATPKGKDEARHIRGGDTTRLRGWSWKARWRCKRWLGWSLAHMCGGRRMYESAIISLGESCTAYEMHDSEVGDDNNPIRLICGEDAVGRRDWSRGRRGMAHTWERYINISRMIYIMSRLRMIRTLSWGRQYQ